MSPSGPRRRGLRGGRAITLALPFLVLAVLLRTTVAPIGDAIAARIARHAPRTSAEALPAPSALPTPLPEDPDREPPRARRTASRRRDAAHEPRDPGDHPSEAVARGDGGAEPVRAKGTFFVPRSVVVRALERRDVGAVNAKGPDGTALGARLRGVSAYGTGLKDGDVVVYVEGTRTPNVDAMVGIAMRAAEAGASRLSGVVLRDGERFNVVLELPRD